MLKKHNKLIMLLVLVTFMFTMVGSAGAASFSDVTGTSAEAAAIYKLNALGIIDGYPDGTFGPEKTITRAEFAKIACVTAGLKSVASGMGGTASPFSDVASSHWANGWINVAAAQGFVKGDPTGTFRPEDQITQAEAVTVLMRLLGYNDNLAGEWPSDYIAKAANLGILDDVTFVANQAATRGVVAIMASGSLEEFKVDYEASNNLFKLTATKLIADKFESALTEDALVTDVDLSDGKIALQFNGAGSYVELADNCVIANAPSWNQVKERFVDYVYNSDDKEITYITVKDYKVVNETPDKVEVTAVAAGKPTKIELDGKAYNVAAGVQILPATVAPAFAVAPGVTIDLALAPTVLDNFDFVLNEDGDIALIKAWVWNATGIVDKVTAKTAKINYKNGVAATDLDEDDAESYYVLRMGLPAALTDIQEDDMVWVKPGVYNVNLIIAVGAKIPGTLEAIKTSGANVTKVKVAGTEWKIAPGGFYLSTDGGDTYTAAASALASQIDGTTNDLFGENVTLIGTPTKKVAAIITDIDGTNSSKIRGVVKEKTSVIADGELYSQGIKLFKGDGTEAKYAVDSDATNGTTFSGVANYAALAVDDAVEITLDADGTIDKLTKLATVDDSGANLLDGDSDLNSISIGGSYFNTADLQVINTDTAGDPVVIKTSDFIDFVEANAAAGGFLVNNFAFVKDGTDLLFVVVKEASLAGTTNLAMVSELGKDVDGYYAILLKAGGEEKIYFHNAADYTTPAAGLADDTVISYKITDGEIVGDTAAKFNTGYTMPKANKTVDELTSTLIKVDGVAYPIDADTVVYDNSDDDPVLGDIADLGTGESVNIYIKTGETAVTVIEIL